jgi:hypothetical protein
MGILDFGYIGTYLESFAKIDPSVIDRIDGMARALGDGDHGAYLSVLAASLSEGPGAGNSPKRLATALERFPDSSLLLYKTVESNFSGVIAGSASSDMMAAAAALPEEPAMVLAAARHATRGEWADLSALDDRLAGVRPTAAWAPTAAQLRVEWRLRVRNPELIQGLSNEALDIIDGQIVRIPNLPMLALRAWTGYRAGDPEAAIGSIAMLSRRVVDADRQLRSGERASLKINMEALFSLIDTLRQQGQIDGKRADGVQSALENAARTL